MTRVLGADRPNGPDTVPVPLMDLGAGGPGSLLDLLERDHVRVIVQAQQRRGRLLDEMHPPDAAARAQEGLQPRHTRISRIGNLW